MVGQAQEGPEGKGVTVPASLGEAKRYRNCNSPIEPGCAGDDASCYYVMGCFGRSVVQSRAQHLPTW